MACCYKDGKFMIKTHQGKGRRKKQENHLEARTTMNMDRLRDEEGGQSWIHRRKTGNVLIFGKGGRDKRIEKVFHRKQKKSGMYSGDIVKKGHIPR